ncbi:MAG: aspartate carbamoyltransferase regulatory subunit [Gammaproteobacteria bacterium]|nr:aspartate carbamoyltransferase regulatory subunit [Gammaproteobacteria bacterium]
MSKTLSVSAIKNGTVIDHIRSGQALRIMRLLRVLEDKNKVTLGLNLPSQLLGVKDLIKSEARELTQEEANEIMIFAPEATINIINDFEVLKKLITHLPASIANVFLCPNPTCITQAEVVDSSFNIKEDGKHIWVSCYYCEKTFGRDQVQVRI